MGSQFPTHPVPWLWLKCLYAASACFLAEVSITVSDLGCWVSRRSPWFGNYWRWKLWLPLGLKATWCDTVDTHGSEDFYRNSIVSIWSYIIIYDLYDYISDLQISKCQAHALHQIPLEALGPSAPETFMEPWEDWGKPALLRWKLTTSNLITLAEMDKHGFHHLRNLLSLPNII